MSPAVERAEAALRLRNTERLLKRMLRSVAARVAARKLSPSEAVQIRREFWESPVAR